MFPIMGISHRNATLFCKWRTNKVFELFLTKNKVIREFHPLDTNIFTIEKYFSGNFHGIKPDTNYLYYFEYSLPTREEWTQSLISSNYENGRYKYPNHQTNPKQTFIDFPEFEYKKCKIKNLNNNVSEWLIDSNQYIGLNWQDSFDLNKLTIVRESNRPSAVLGFRNIGKWKKWEGKVFGM
ncbi:MAG: hypothetical protein ACK43K_14165 [Chitinophagales bacterium]